MTAPAAAILFVSLVGAAVLFQLALAAGAPWGRLAMGGRYPGRLPPGMRAAAVVQALVLVALAAIVLVRAGLVLPELRGAAAWAIWLVVGFSALSVVMHLITPSRWERRLWGPVALGLLVSSAAVALSS